MLINTFLDTEDFVHLYYPEDEPAAAAAQGCGAGARMASKYPPRPPSPDYPQTATASTSEMSDRERYRSPPQPEPPPHRVRAADLYPRLRTHYDDPGLEVPFAPICGEFVQWVGRMADGGIIAMSNYRLHAQPRRRSELGTSVPIRLIDALEIRDLLHLIILCKNGRQLSCSFTTGEQCVEWWRRLNTAMAPITSIQETFAAAYAAWAKEQPASSVHRALLKASHDDQTHWFWPEAERLGFTSSGAWRVTSANEKYELCPSYPPLLLVPAAIGDEDLDSVARFRAMRRIPAVVWRHRGNGAVIARSSQPEVGWFGWRSSEDERLLAALPAACAAGRAPPAGKPVKLLIVDARSYASAVTNRARGGGCEHQQYYPLADIQFMSMPNIHHVRRSFHHLRALAADPADQGNWLSNVERTLWLQYVCGIGRAAGAVCRAVAAGRPALVHCSDGWDRTPQVVAAAQLLLDPHYRTRAGFRTLVQREWLDYGHKFADRCGHQRGPEDPNERSPIFLQWLDFVHQLARQHPCSFEFNEAYLIKLATHVHSCMFGTFLCNTMRERSETRDMAHVWHLLQAPAYRNHLYSPHQPDEDAIVWAEYSVRAASVWRMFGASRAAPHAAPAGPAHAPMTKTRSCDNLLNEGEKKTAQRRCSDPSIAPDVMKLSMVAAECETRRACRAALTDSCVDALPGLPTPAGHQVCMLPTPAGHQVDGMVPEPFDPRGPHDLASDSSSLERELCPPTAPAPARGADMPADMPADMRVDMRADGDTPDEPPVFVCDTYTDVIGMAEAARDVGRTRNVSITWRSISESSNQSSSTGFDIADTPNRLDNSLPNSLANSRANSVVNSRANSHESSPLDNHNSTEGDLANHNVVGAGNELNGRVNGVNGVNGTLNGIDDVATKFLEVDLNGGATSSSVSSESEGEAGGARRAGRGRGARGSQATLCPASPRRACARCRAPAHESVELGPWCGGPGCACGGPACRQDPADGLPPDADPLQDRLHQIILYQRQVVQELSSQLRSARAALRRAPPAPAPGPAPAPAPPAAAHNHQRSSGSGSAGSGSGSGSASEVEVGEEARGVVWLPDSAAPRCQHCHHHFWLARRRHHCRRCGGIFCGSCSSLSPWGERGAVRVCRPCRAAR